MNEARYMTYACVECMQFFGEGGTDFPEHMLKSLGLKIMSIGRISKS
jgi:hypothetical protein